MCLKKGYLIIMNFKINLYILFYTYNNKHFLKEGRHRTTQHTYTVFLGGGVNSHHPHAGDLEEAGVAHDERS